jgi:prophage antirepressor-like protein
MDNIKVEKWLDYEIRFVEHEGEWWAVANDVAKALEYSRPHKAISDNCKGALTKDILTKGGKQKTKIISELDIYELIFTAANQSTSQNVKEKAIQFKHWVYDMLRELRKSTGLEGFQIFRMLDTEHQKEMMETLRNGLDNPNKISYIKANTIANIKKADMTPDMLVKRQSILDDTVELMTVKNKYGLDLSVSEKIYNKYTS